MSFINIYKHDSDEDNKNEAFFFQNGYGGKFEIVSLRKMVKTLVTKSNVNKNITPHSFRRSFATFHSRNKVPIEDI